MATNNPDVYTPVRKEGLLDKELIQEKVSEARDRIGSLAERGRDRVMAWEGNFESHVADHPVRSILIAAGVGAVLGLLLARR